MLIEHRPSLFGRLYAVILVAITAAVFLARIIIESQGDENEFIYFNATSNYLQGIIDQNHQQPVEITADSSFSQITLPSPYDEEFVAAWISTDLTKQDFCPNCSDALQTESAHFYETLDVDGMAIYSYPNSQHKLLLSNSDNVSISGTALKEDLFDFLIVYWIIGITSLFVGISIYWPLSSLQKQISQLIRSHQLFGNGMLEVRADESLVKPLDELATSFNAMASSIETSVKENQVFSQAIPHELRTPLSRIQMASGLLRKSKSQEDSNKLIDDIDHYIEDINGLVSAIVSFSKLKTIPQNTEVDSEAVNLKEFVENRIAELNKDSKKSVSVDIDDGINFKTKTFFFRLALDNTVSNAIKYSESSVKISARYLGNVIALDIEDDGAGINASDRESVFLPFHRLDDSRSRRTGGLGLGLAIAKAAANHLNGDIKIHKSDLGGSKFSISIDKDENSS